MVPPDSEGISPVPTYSGFCYVKKLYTYRAVTFFGRPSQTVLFPFSSKKQSYNPNPAVTELVWANPRSLATTCGITVVFFSSGYLDVSVPQVGLLCRILGLQPSELSHSDTFGSTLMCRSPNIFAAYRVLHRLREPRHSPHALCNFFLNTLVLLPV